MVRDSTDCLIEARGAECVSHAKTLWFLFQDLQQEGVKRMTGEGGKDVRSSLYSFTLEPWATNPALA